SPYPVSLFCVQRGQARHDMGRKLARGPGSHGCPAAPASTRATRAAQGPPAGPSRGRGSEALEARGARRGELEAPAPARQDGRAVACIIRQYKRARARACLGPLAVEKARGRHRGGGGGGGGGGGRGRVRRRNRRRRRRRRSNGKWKNVPMPRSVRHSGEPALARPEATGGGRPEAARPNPARGAGGDHEFASVQRQRGAGAWPEQPGGQVSWTARPAPRLGLELRRRSAGREGQVWQVQTLGRRP
ncbi:unnamed protein product, partial [Prorocentrum cordatum]